MEDKQHSHEGKYFWLGQDTLKVPMSLFRHNRERLIARLEDSQAPAGLILLEGGKQTTRHDTDHEPLFRQESFFHYLFGVTEGDFYGAIDLAEKKTMLFIPRLPEAYAVWMGAILPPSAFKDKYEVDEVYYVDEIDTILTQKGVSLIYTIKGVNSDSGNEAQEAKFPGIEKYKVDNQRLFPEIVECRVIKSPEEIEVMRYVNRVSSEAHVKVMQRCKPGMMEYQLESIFQYESYYHGGCRHCSYTCICGSGDNSSVLHYGHAGAPNNKEVNDGDMLLLDMGAEYYCYGSDITCSFPANGKFTPNQRIVYESVHAAQLAVFDAMKPGVLWPDMHRLAYRVICEHLLKHGLLKGSVEELLANHIAALFMPHGLGHFLGIDTHDPGGYPAGVERIQEPGIRSLRSGRVLQAGMVLTIEPGIYFISALLEPAFKDEVKKQFLNEERIREFMGSGGVRLEDDVVVTETGAENLTICPRTVEEVEACMAGKPWQKK